MSIYDQRLMAPGLFQTTAPHRRKYTGPQAREMRRAYEEGASVPELAARYERSPNTIIRAIKYAGGTIRPKHKRRVSSR